MLGVAILRHEDRAGRGLRVVEWISFHPGCECRSILIAEAPLEKLGRFAFAIELGSKPGIEGIVIVDPLLAGKGSKPFSSDSNPICLGVFLCTSTRPCCSLVSTPRGSNGDKRENQCLDYFNYFPSGLRGFAGLAHLV